jgi:D-serine deaminase-like pyridoxal phosphate-dependent protein
VSERLLSVRDKSIPAALWGRTATDSARERHPLSEFLTPLMTFDRAASDHNVTTLVTWATARGLELAPHGKTTMAPELWRRLLDAGAWGLTLATPWQVQVARAEGIRRILLANQLVDPVAIAWLARELDADPEFEFACWVDSAESIRALAESAGDRPIDVLVELGDAGGRTGARGTDAALAVARLVANEPRLRLRGVAGYEGSYGAERTPETIDRIRGYLRAMRGLAEVLIAEWAFHDEAPIVTAGGSTWFDLVAEEWAGLEDHATLVLRSGAFQAHDDVFYTGNSPFTGTELAFRPALAAWARVVSRPEPTLALLDAGKRDLPSDLDLPVPHRTTSGLDLSGARVIRLADQHAYLELPADSSLAVGDVVKLGISHPCTAFDKWRLLPEVDDAEAAEPRVIGFIETVF